MCVGRTVINKDGSINITIHAYMKILGIFLMLKLKKQDTKIFLNGMNGVSL